VTLIAQERNAPNTLREVIIVQGGGGYKRGVLDRGFLEKGRAGKSSELLTSFGEKPKGDLELLGEDTSKCFRSSDDRALGYSPGGANFGNGTKPERIG